MSLLLGLVKGCFVVPEVQGQPKAASAEQPCPSQLSRDQVQHLEGCLDYQVELPIGMSATDKMPPARKSSSFKQWLRIPDGPEKPSNGKAGINKDTVKAPVVAVAAPPSAHQTASKPSAFMLEHQDLGLTPWQSESRTLTPMRGARPAEAGMPPAEPMPVPPAVTVPPAALTAPRLRTMRALPKTCNIKPPSVSPSKPEPLPPRIGNSNSEPLTKLPAAKTVRLSLNGSTDGKVRAYLYGGICTDRVAAASAAAGKHSLLETPAVYSLSGLRASKYGKSLSYSARPRSAADACLVQQSLHAYLLSSFSNDP